MGIELAHYQNDSTIVPNFRSIGEVDVSDVVNNIRHSLDAYGRVASHSPHQSDIILLDTVDVNLYKALVNEPSLLRALDWRVFEILLADMLESFGYLIELKRGTKDGGIDIIAIKKTTDFGQHKYLIQAKRWEEKVGVDPVRSLLFLHNEFKATKSCLATTSMFTQGAWQLANRYRWQLELKDSIAIQDWVKESLTRKQRGRLG